MMDYLMISFRQFLIQFLLFLAHTDSPPGHSLVLASFRVRLFTLGSPGGRVWSQTCHRSLFSGVGAPDIPMPDASFPLTPHPRLLV